MADRSGSRTAIGVDSGPTRPNLSASGAVDPGRVGTWRAAQAGSGWPLVGTTPTMNDSDLVQTLTSDVERLFERHLATTKEWFPHDYVPYGRGRDIEGRPWMEADADLGGATIDGGVRSALIVNVLTEDNLPFYFRTIERMFGSGGVFGAWVRRWTAEEGRHAMAIYGYLMATRAVDPVALERSRMCQVSAGCTPEPPSAADGMVYVALQELATRISHHNTGRLLGDPVGFRVMKRVAADENLHHLFYRDLTTAAIEVDPSLMVKAIERQVVGFEMPGAGIPGFAGHAAVIARSGIYDLSIHHDQILAPVVLGHWAVAGLAGLDDEAERSRDRLLSRLAKSERVARRLRERHDERVAAR